MAEARIETVTLLFTDLERSTEVRRRLGDDEAQALWRSHLRLLRSVVAAHAGQEVKTRGDGIMVAFGNARDALACAVAMQQAVHRQNEHADESHRQRMRVGLDVGDASHEENDYFGMPVVVAERLCSEADGGQILASERLRGVVGSLGGYDFSDSHSLALKGIDEPLGACEVLWEHLLDESAAPLPPRLASEERTTFVGRERELERLRHHWERARGGQRQLALVTGEPGIGKTRLAAEFAISAHAEGATVLFGRSDESAELAYQPFAEALRHYVVTCPTHELRNQIGARGPALTRLVPELSERLPDLPVPPSVEPEGERHRLFEAVAHLLAEASHWAPVVIILDDLHWADEPSLLMLKHIVRSQGQSPLLILGTYRETELPRTHPLSRALADLRRDHAFDRLSLGGMSKGDVGALIGTRAGGDAPPAFVQAIHEQTEGNPFFIEEVLRHLTETGAISQQEGRLTTDPSVAELAIPEGVKEVIGQRLSRLSEECNSVLTVASVIGREFGLDALERASDLSGDRLLDLVEEAVAARVVSEVPHVVGRYGFSHALIYETLYEELTTTRRVSLHGQTLQYADSGGVKLAYEVLGSSGPFVIAVGLSSCPVVRSQIWPMARRWDRIARFCRVILYDRRGVGFSTAAAEGYSLDDCAQDLNAVLDAVGVKQAVLWGATDGGPLAIAYAAQHPERVSGLILLGTSPKLVSWWDYAWGINPAIADSFLRLDAVDQGEAASHLVRARHARSDEANAIGEVLRRVPRPVWAKIVAALAIADARPLLAQVRAPTLIIHDADNQYIPVGAAHYLHEHMSGSRLEITDEYGSSVFGDTLYGKIGSFIKEVTARGQS
jgi:class 3 adenylate cyclase/pimeloyl-ACP methyl ester carboxylesterase